MYVELPLTHLQINPKAFVISILGLQLVLIFFYRFIEALPKCSTFSETSDSYSLFKPFELNSNVNLAILPTPFFLERAHFCEPGKIIPMPKFFPKPLFLFFSLFLFLLKNEREGNGREREPAPAGLLGLTNQADHPCPKAQPHLKPSPTPSSQSLPLPPPPARSPCSRSSPSPPLALLSTHRRGIPIPQRRYLAPDPPLQPPCAPGPPSPSRCLP